MLLFSSILNITDSFTPDAFLRVVIAWNAESSRDENRVKGIFWQGEHTARFGMPDLWLEFVESSDGNIVAARHEKSTGDGIVWDSDFIVNFSERKIAVQLDRTYSEDALVIDGAFSTPHFISFLIRQGYLKDDRDLPILREPLEITDEQGEMICHLVNGERQYRLPVVLVFKSSDGKDPLEVTRLASRLKGAAHVLLEEDPSQCRMIRETCGTTDNEFGGIRIFYPSGPIKEKKITYRSAAGDSKARLERVVQQVIKYCLAQRIDPMYTWQGVNNCVLNEQLKNQIEGRKSAESARQKAEEEVDMVYESFDEDLKKLQEQIEDLTKANEALQYENQGLRAKYAAVESVPLIYSGEEEEFYQGEIRDAILSSLNEILSATESATRKADILKDVLENNPYYHLAEERKQRVKSLFKGYKNLTGAMRQELLSLGFEITEEGKHYKITYREDPRYMVTIGKTPSDSRSGNNNAALISKKML